MTVVPWWQRALLVVLVIAAYAPVLPNEFVRWDDLQHVVQNPRVVEPDGLIRSWRETESPGFYPITYTTFFFEWRVSGGKPWLFHLDNVLLHAASALLVLRLCRELTLGATVGWFVAALWGLHPLQVASVAWIAERKNVLSAFLWLAALLLYLVAGRVSPRVRRVSRVFSVVLFAMALLSKAAAMTLPAAIVLVEWGRGRRLDRSFWLSLVPYGAVAIAGGGALLASVPPGMNTSSFASRIVHAPRALCWYVTTFFWPHDLLVLYPRWDLAPTGSRDVLAWLALVGLGAVGLTLRNRIPRVVALGIGLFLANVALVVGIVWFTFLGQSPVGDHLSYLPNLGLALAVVPALAALARAARVPERALAATLAVWCAVLGVATWRQIHVWHDTETLWNHTLAHNPQCAPCEYNLGVLFEVRGQRSTAAAHYARALGLEPDTATATNLGNLRLAQGREAEAAALYGQAIELDRTNDKAWNNLGLVLARQGRTEEAIAHYREAVRLAPDWAAAHRNLGEALSRVERTAEAKAELETAGRLKAGETPAAGR